MTAADWIALLGIALPLAAKVAVDLAAYLTARKHTALANIVGMAGRQAGTIARGIAALPPGSTDAAYEQSLIALATTSVLTEMSGSAATAGATDTKVAGIIQGEVDKLLTPATVLTVPVARIPPSPIMPKE